MYGFVNSALEKLIKRRFGVEKWEEIRTFANVHLGDTDSFQVNHVYRDANTYTVVSAASEVLGLDAGSILEMFGEQFLLWCQESGYSKTLRLLGRSLQDFLTNLDALHDHLSIIYPQMDAPSFRCTGGFKKSEFLLHYYSDRIGLENIVMGIVKSVAREYYNTEVEMRLLVQRGPESDHSIFSIREMAYHSQTIAEGLAETEAINSFSDRQLISSETFCKAFPFHIIFDAKLRILQVGSSLSWVLPNLKLKESQLDQYFALERPRMKLYFDTILSHINTIFVLRMIHGSSGTTAEKGPRTDRISVSLSSGKDPMRLRGQMIYAPESEAMLFLCSPRVKRLNDLEQRGLYLSDIPIHDATRGMLMMGQAAAAEFTKSVRLEELIIELKATQKSLEEEKRRMSDLLHQMLPISVADSLMAGQMVEAERFESVTILFSDVVGFTSICGHSEPMQIVNMLNRLYSMFDQVVGQNQVYKVETIGDAYMVVGGLPERNNIHAECVANQALDMMHYCQQVKRPDNGENIVMRIGIHSGPVVAGIVGRRMPRYCLFGNTVNVASRTESNGTPGKIQVTEYTYKLLQDRPNFKFEFRERLQFKNVEDLVSCYYLLENTEKDYFTSVVVSDELEHMTYQFMIPRTPVDSPPTTPLPPASPLPAGIGEILSYPSGSEFDRPPRCPFSRNSPYEEVSFHIPEFNVIQPTPGHTPNPTPPTSKRSSLTDVENQFRFSPHTSPPPSDRGTSSSPEHDSDIEMGGLFMSPRCNTPPLGRSLAGGSRVTRPPELDLAVHSTSPFMDTMRKVSLSPLREDMDEEELLRETPTDEIDKSSSLLSVIDGDEGIVMRKLSDISIQSQESNSGLDLASAGKSAQRRISDASNHSGESGIESSASKFSDLKDHQDGDSMAESVRKSSATSNGSVVEDELKELRRARAGSVKGAIEIYNTLERQRKTGLSTTAYVNGTDLHTHLKMPTSPTHQHTPPPPNTAATLRPARKSLDSVGSSGSND